MPRPSSVDKLDEEVREEIARLRANGHSLDEILAALRELDVENISRSALGRHIQGIDKLVATNRRSRTVAQALARQMGDANASQFARANIELLHGIILDLHMAAEGGDDTSWLETLRGNPRGVEALAKALDHLTRASKTDAEFVKEIQEQTEARLRKQAESNLKDEGKRQGLSVDVVAAMAAGLFKVKKK
jgi:DNA-binding CsgD family transcriptional regulator